MIESLNYLPHPALPNEELAGHFTDLEIGRAHV